MPQVETIRMFKGQADLIRNKGSNLNRLVICAHGIWNKRNFQVPNTMNLGFFGKHGEFLLANNEDIRELLRAPTGYKQEIVHRNSTCQDYWLSYLAVPARYFQQVYEDGGNIRSDMVILKQGSRIALSDMLQQLMNDFGQYSHIDAVFCRALSMVYEEGVSPASVLSMGPGATPPPPPVMSRPAPGRVGPPTAPRSRPSQVHSYPAPDYD